MKHATWVTAALLVAGAAVSPLVWALDRTEALPLALRDRPVPVVLAATCIALAGAWVSARPGASRPRARRPRAAALAAAAVIASAAVFAWRAHAPFVLPPASPSVRVGAKLPAVTLTDEQGHPVPLADLRDKPTLVIWFMGTWCPYCRHQLQAMGAAMKRYGSSVRVVGVTSDPPDELLALRQELGLPFSLLSDPDGVMLGRCELMHCVAIADDDGVVRWGVLSGNWREDVPERALLQAAYAAR